VKRKDDSRHVRFAPVPGPRVDFVKDEVGGGVWHCFQHRPIYADTDAAQVVYHANYLRFFELGRVEMMRAIGQTHRSIEESGFYHPIVDLQMHFFQPLHYDDLMVIYTRPRKLERVKVTIDYRITHADGGAMACSGKTVHACLNKQTLKPVAIDAISVDMQRFFEKLEGR